ncbi:hypothetical protein PTKU46_49830 [Paraburkholderia terrae]
MKHANKTRMPAQTQANQTGRTAKPQARVKTKNQTGRPRSAQSKPSQQSQTKNHHYDMWTPSTENTESLR